MTEYEDATLLQRRGLHAQALAAYKDLLKHHANDGDLLGTIGLFYYHELLDLWFQEKGVRKSYDEEQTSVDPPEKKFSAFASGDHGWDEA